VNTVANERNALFHNNGNSNGWLIVRLVGTRSNRDDVGAKVRASATVWGRPTLQTRQIGGRAVSEPRAHFGLGNTTKVTTLRIEWASGAVQDLSAPIDPRSGRTSFDRATYCLAWLGTNALPALTAVIRRPHRNRWQAFNSIWLMEQHQPTAQFPITAIISCLEDTNDPNMPRKAACILSDLKVAPELCVPALVAGLQSKSPSTRASSAWALG
jgi:hypothetical protein